MRALLLGSIVVIGLAAGLQTAGGAPLLPSGATGPASKTVPAAVSRCGKGQHWVASGYARHGKYRAGHCAPN